MGQQQCNMLCASIFVADVVFIQWSEWARIRDKTCFIKFTRCCLRASKLLCMSASLLFASQKVLMNVAFTALRVIVCVEKGV